MKKNIDSISTSKNFELCNVQWRIAAEKLWKQWINKQRYGLPVFVLKIKNKPKATAYSEIIWQKKNRYDQLNSLALLFYPHKVQL